MIRYISIIVINIMMIMSVIGCAPNTVEVENEEVIEDISAEVNEIDLQDEQKNDSIDALEDEIEEEDISIERTKIELSSEKQREINIFLSNFTEVFFLDFEDQPSNEILINFGVRHNYINNWRAMEVRADYGFLDKSKVERSVKRFFDLDLQHKKTDQYDFDGNHYIIRLADGETLPMAVVQEMYDNNDGSYTVYFDEVFSYDLLDYSITPHKLPTEINKDPDRIWMGDSKQAIVERHNFEGKFVYKLIEYKTIPQN